jgi:hypothetical protein
MANDVFANNREVSCKKADGKSIAAFPDVCFTPPENPATPPGTPVPYPNTGMARDTTNGSRSVKITGNEIMLKNRSYFKKSSGDEAGSAAKKGTLTSVNRGKAYFTSWSMDVKVEGVNVVRHLDTTTHNHASYPSNSPVWPYIDSQETGFAGPCEDDPPDPCSLVPYKDGCPDNAAGEKRTPHHVIPAHCFHPPGYASIRSEFSRETYHSLDYRHSRAPCICVTGEDKSAVGTEHFWLHKLFDAREDARLQSGQAGTWTYGEAKQAAIESVENVCPECSEDCIATQLDNYHQQAGCNDSTPIRADSTGQHGDVDLARGQMLGA